MSKIISIDTSSNKKISIRLEINDVTKEGNSNSTVLKSEAALPLIDKLLKDNSLEMNQIDEIKVDMGPGSFTGLRVGASIANALGFLLQISVNGKKIGDLAEPVYNK